MKRILEYIEEHKLINDNDNIVIGLSGGADSVCLLYVLTTLRKEKDIHIKTVHINHMIRETAARDEDFSRDLSYQLNVDYVSDKTDCIGISKRDSISVEEAGRNERYRIFKKVGDETFGEGNYKIAVAHHMDDLAETFIFNMTRGTGIAGLTSVKPVSGNIIRPLLCITKKDIEEILTNEGLKHVEDETNSLDDYARNKIRHNVIPVLNEVTQSATEHIAMLSERLSDIEDYLDIETDEAYQKYCTVSVLSNRENTNSQLDEKKEVTISEVIKTLHKAIEIRVIHRALIEVAGRARDIARVQIEAVENLFALEVGKKRDLIYNMEAIREKEGVLIRKKTDVSGDGEVIVDNEERANLLESLKKRVNLTVVDRDFSQNIPTDLYTKWFDYDKIENCPSVRFRENGDYLTINDDGQRKLLSDYMINEKIAASDRDTIPLLADGEHVMWLVGHRISAAYKVSDSTKRVLIATYTLE